MNKVIVITGALSGFGALTARALSREGHTVYASMRETMGRNVSQVEGAKKFSEKNGVDLRTIANAIVQVVDAPFGKRPFRVHDGPIQDGAEVVNMVSDRVRAELLRRIGLTDVLTPQDFTVQSKSAA
jgi:NAD(P)-dependent dehydrogenase (short-subunit alcohol dehydrogenase family)